MSWNRFSCCGVTYQGRAAREGMQCLKVPDLTKCQILIHDNFTSARGIVFYSVEEALSIPSPPPNWAAGHLNFGDFVLYFRRTFHVDHGFQGTLSECCLFMLLNLFSTLQIDSRAAASAFVGIENVRQFRFLTQPWHSTPTGAVCRSCSRIYLKGFSVNISTNVIHDLRGFLNKQLVTS